MKQYVILAASLLFAGWCSLPYATPWPTFRGNMHRTGFSAEKVGVPVDTPLWVDSLGCQTVSSPSIVDGVLFLGARDGNLYALTAKSGKIFWKQGLKGWLDASPLVHQGMVIIGSYGEETSLLDKQRGTVLQSVPSGLQISSPAVTSEGTFLWALGAPLHGLAAHSFLGIMQESWQVPLARMSYSSPAVEGSMCVVATADGALSAIHLPDRSLRWAMRTQGGVFLSTPAIDGNMVYFAPGNYDPYIYAVHLDDGGLAWRSNGTPLQKVQAMQGTLKNQIQPNDFIKLLRLSPADREAVIGKLGKQNIRIPKILALSANNDSASVWDFLPYGDMKTSSVAIGPENVYVIQKELGYPKPRFSILALNKETGREAWYFSELRNCVPEGYCSSPVVADGMVFFGWGEGKLFAFNEKAGKKIWETSVNGDIISSPAISDGVLYVATHKGYVYAYDLAATPQPANFQDGTYGYPNPASKTSKIQYFLQKPGDIEVFIYDAAERIVKVFKKTGIKANTKDMFLWDVANAANGVYFARIVVNYRDGGSENKILKIAVIK